MVSSNNKIFIIGHGANALALVNKFKKQNEDFEIFITSSNDLSENLDVKYVDIRENNPTELLSFAVKNEIDLTVVTSNEALKTDVASFFTDNNQNIFAPSIAACDFTLDKAFCKKYMYNLEIPTPKFAIFEREQLALDYLKKATYPVIISTSATTDKEICRFVCPNEHIARTFVGDLYFRNEPKVIIEEFLYGHEFTYYFITDGYQALPLCSCANYKFLNEDNGGKLTDGIGCFCNDYKIDKSIENNLSDIINSILKECQENNSPYLGIIGAECILLNNGEYSVLEFKPFFKDHDANAVLNLINNNIYNIFNACTNGSFADDYEEINISDKSSVSCVLLAKSNNEIISGISDIEHSEITYSNLKFQNGALYTTKNQRLVLTAEGTLLSRAKKKLREDVETISYKGKYFRKDICSD